MTLRWGTKPKSKGAALVENAGTKLVMDRPFFAAGYLRLALEEIPGCGTFFTDGRRIGFDPAFAEKLEDVDQCEFVLCHEVLHNLLCHPYRRGHRDPSLWNDACDYAINDALVAMGLTMPKGEEVKGLLDARFKDMSAEAIYEVLLKEQQAQQPQPQQGGGGGQQGQPKPGSGKPGKGAGQGKEAKKDKADGSGKNDQQGKADEGSGQGQPQQQGGSQGQQDGGGGSSKPNLPERRNKGFDVMCDAAAENGQPLSQPEAEAQMREWEIVAQVAAMQQTAKGDMPGFLKELIKPAKPNADWRALLGKWMQEKVAADYRWDRPNARYAASRLYLPAMRDDAMGEMVVAVDTSGSINSELLARFIAEVEAQRMAVNPRKVYVVVCDAMVRATYEFEQNEPIEGVEALGRGGTNFRPVFDWVERQGLQPACMVYLTDLCGSFPKAAPDYPVCWVNFDPSTAGSEYERRAAELGEVVHIAPER